MELSTGYWFQLGKWNTDTGQFDRYRANGCKYMRLDIILLLIIPSAAFIN